jgi:hypothetical protein
MTLLQIARVRLRYSLRPLVIARQRESFRKGAGGLASDCWLL